MPVIGLFSLKCHQTENTENLDYTVETSCPRSYFAQLPEFAVDKLTLLVTVEQGFLKVGTVLIRQGNFFFFKLTFLHLVTLFDLKHFTRGNVQ